MSKLDAVVPGESLYKGIVLQNYVKHPQSFDGSGKIESTGQVLYQTPQRDSKHRSKTTPI